MYHGFRLTHSMRNLKPARGYVIPATQKEDSEGVDFWVKMPRDLRIIPVQITQRGVRHFRKHHKPSHGSLLAFNAQSEKRLKEKRLHCKRSGIAFLLVRDYDGALPSRSVAWGDIKALRYALKRLPSAGAMRPREA